MRKSGPGSVSNWMLCAFTVANKPVKTNKIKKVNSRQDSQLTALITLHICFSNEVTFHLTSIWEIFCPWDHHCWIITTNGRCVVWCSGWIVTHQCVLSDDYTDKKKKLLLLFWVCGQSHFLKSVSCVSTLNPTKIRTTILLSAAMISSPLYQHLISWCHIWSAPRWWSHIITEKKKIHTKCSDTHA